jgi:hypothetical protein
MTALYLWSMRKASCVLFAVALISLLSGAFPLLLFFQQQAHDLYGQSSPMENTLIVESILRGVGAVGWPLFGAALLWRIDRYYAALHKEAAE